MLFREAEGHIEGSDKREPPMNPAQSETPGMLGNSMREKRETPLVSGRKRPDRLEKATSYKASAYVSGESDSAVVPAKCSNKGAVRLAESMEGRALAKKNPRPRSHAPDPVPGKACPRVGSGVRQVAGHALDAILQGRSRMH